MFFGNTFFIHAIHSKHVDIILLECFLSIICGKPVKLSTFLKPVLAFPRVSIGSFLNTNTIHITIHLRLRFRGIRACLALLHHKCSNPLFVAINTCKFHGMILKLTWSYVNCPSSSIAKGFRFTPLQSKTLG